jgi:hypothetical protein
VYFGQLVLKRLKLAHPLLNDTQLLGDKHPQSGPNSRTVFGLKVADQSLEVSQRKVQSTSAADEQQLINVGTRVLSVACAVPGGWW